MPDSQQLPTAIDPQKLQMLATLFPQQGGGSPQPSAGPSPNLTEMMTTAAGKGMEAFGTESTKARELGGQVGSEIQAQASTPVPKMSWMDTQGKPQQGGFLHNLGRALMAIGGATLPGRAIQSAQYGPGIARYEAETGARAKRISELQGEEKEAGTRATAGASMVSKPITALGTEERGRGILQQATVAAQKIALQHQDNLARIAAMTDIAGKKNATEIEVTKMRDEMQREITGMKDVTQEDVARIMASSAQTLLNTKIAEDPSIAGAIKRAFGLGGAEAPGGAQPVAGQAPLPARAPTKPAAKAGAVAKGTHVWDNKGVEHIADGTQPLPKGWSTKKPGA